MPQSGLLSSTTDRYEKYNLVSARSRCGYNNVGNEYWLFDYAMWWTLTLLMIVDNHPKLLKNLNQLAIDNNDMIEAIIDRINEKSTDLGR